MGLSITLINFKAETIDRVDDPKNLLHKLLPSANEDSDRLLAAIDWYAAIKVCPSNIWVRLPNSSHSLRNLFI